MLSIYRRLRGCYSGSTRVIERNRSRARAYLACMSWINRKVLREDGHGGAGRAGKEGEFPPTVSFLTWVGSEPVPL
jgi:hypothetical protein